MSTASRLRFATLFAAISTVLTGAIAQNVYKCGDTYSDQPCAQGRVIAPAPTPSASAVAASRAATQRDQALADRMEASRLAQEKAAAQVAAAAQKANTKALKKPARCAKGDATTPSSKGCKPAGLVGVGDKPLVVIKAAPSKKKSHTKQATDSVAFVAEVPGSRPAKKKTASNKTTAPANSTVKPSP